MQSIPLHDQVDVLIVGMGPVGAALANLLGRYGTRTLVIDKAREIYQSPRAIALDNEALRILQMCGLEEGELDTIAIPEVKMLSPLFGQYGRAVTAGVVDGHPRLVTFYQPQLESILRRRVLRQPGVETALGCELVSFEQCSGGVRASLRSDDGVARVVSAKYLVGADGAGSAVRKMLDLGFEGKTYTEDWLVVDARNAADPISHVEFICDHRRPTPRMVAPGGRQRWEFKLMPGETREQMEHPDKVRELLRPWSSGREPDIERVAVYRFHARLVDRFQRGRVFLVGDAAHITPPFVGQGLVAGLRDAGNLAWKLAWGARGQVTSSVLDSYDTERRPHARKMIRLATFMGKLVMPANPMAAFVTHGLMNVAARLPRLKNLFENLEIKPPHRYPQGCFVRGRGEPRLVRGGTLPQVWLKARYGCKVRLSDDLLGAGFAVVGFGCDPASAVSEGAVQAWRRLGGRFVQIDPAGTAPQPTGADIVGEDIAGALMPFTVPVGWIAIVRPDRFVLHDGPVASSEIALREALDLLTA